MSDDQTVASNLQKRLGRPVGNLGVAGYGSMHELIVLEKDVPKYKPDILVWFFFEGNDLYDDHDFENALLAGAPDPEETRSHPQGLARTQGWAKRSFTKALLDRLRRWTTPLLPAKAPYFGHLVLPDRHDEIVYFSDYAGVPWSDWLASRWQKTTATFRQAVRIAEQRGVHLVFCFVPIKFRVYGPYVRFPERSTMSTWTTWPINEQFLEFCESEDIPCLDLTGLFQNALREGGRPYQAVDTHWSPEGHDLVAARLAAEFCQREWIGNCR